MKTHYLFFLLIMFCSLNVFAQSNFSLEEYIDYIEQNANMKSSQLLEEFAPRATYYSDYVNELSVEKVYYLDSIIEKFELTEAELELLEKNRFMVTERLTGNSFGNAFHKIYVKDMPVFISTDAILYALHKSYDQILISLERSIMEPNIKEVIDNMYANFSTLKEKYNTSEVLDTSLLDVDLYITVAKSLINDTVCTPRFVSEEKVAEVLEAVESETSNNISLFSERSREIDFSQFTVRGHYVDDEFVEYGITTSLEPYFRAMMWLGRIDFYLTAPPDEIAWTKEEIRRMNVSAVMLNELVDIAGARETLNKNDDILTYMIGESDNITPTELTDVLSEMELSAADLLDDDNYDNYLEKINSSMQYGQKILSSIFIMNPYNPEPDELPVAFLLSGQRFILDSYVFSNVVYDRIIYNDKKIWRPMPDPLDAMFVLGNDDALPLLEDELDTYKYSSQLNSLRYLVDAYDTGFWEESLYNIWLQSIRAVNPPDDQSIFPYFMQTTAWHQEKLNTQLASWAQLRHDNLLYAKQSYTGATGCSFPHSYVEPYPDFYNSIATFAESASEYFSTLTDVASGISGVCNYFDNLKEVMEKLESIAQKELDRTVISSEEDEFLKTMIFVNGGSGNPPYSGWYADLFYVNDDAAELDYVIADVHTQPTDASGNPVGKILHVGVGEINVGVFIAQAPNSSYRTTAFIGPVMSYYEKITENYYRLTDEEWETSVNSGNVPERPDWVNCYLADNSGEQLKEGRTLTGVSYSIVTDIQNIDTENMICNSFPNPFDSFAQIQLSLQESGYVNISIYDCYGSLIEVLNNKNLTTGDYLFNWNAANQPAGLYFCKIKSSGLEKTIKLLHVK